MDKIIGVIRPLFIQPASYIFHNPQIVLPLTTGALLLGHSFWRLRQLRNLTEQQPPETKFDWEKMAPLVKSLREKEKIPALEALHEHLENKNYSQAERYIRELSDALPEDQTELANLLKPNKLKIDEAGERSAIDGEFYVGLGLLFVGGLLLHRSWDVG